MGQNMSDLDDILNGVETTTEVPVVVEETTTTEAEVDVTTQAETGEEAATQEAAVQTEETPSSEEVKQDTQTLVPVKALESERHKRQELEARLAKLEEKPAEEETVPDMYEDPEGYQKYQERKAEERDAENQHQRFLDRCEMSEMLVKNLHGEKKYLAARQAFIDESDRNPALKAQLQQSSNPALFAYEQGTKLMAMAEIGDPVAFKERVFQEGYEKGLAEAKATFDGTQQATEELANQIPTSLADEQTAGGRSTEKWSGPEAISDLLPN